MACAVYEHVQLNYQAHEQTWCPICKQEELQENCQLIHCTRCKLQLSKDDEVNLDSLRNRLADVHAEHLDQGCRLKPKFSIETSFGSTALYISCQGCSTFEEFIKSAFQDRVSDELKKIKDLPSNASMEISATADEANDVLWEYDGLHSVYQGECEEILLERQRIFYEDLRTGPARKEPESNVETLEDQEDEYLAHAVYEHMQLNDQVDFSYVNIMRFLSSLLFFLHKFLAEMKTIRFFMLGTKHANRHGAPYVSKESCKKTVNLFIALGVNFSSAKMMRSIWIACEIDSPMCTLNILIGAVD